MLKRVVKLSNVIKHHGKAHGLLNALDSSGNLAKLWAEMALCY